MHATPPHPSSSLFVLLIFREQVADKDRQAFRSRKKKTAWWFQSHKCLSKIDFKRPIWCASVWATLSFRNCIAPRANMWLQSVVMVCVFLCNYPTKEVLVWIPPTPKNIFSSSYCFWTAVRVRFVQFDLAPNELHACWVRLLSSQIFWFSVASCVSNSATKMPLLLGCVSIM